MMRARFYAVCGINLDITDRRRADEAVRESEERLRLALDAGHMGSGIGTFSRTKSAGPITSSQSTALRRAPLTGRWRPLRNLIHSDDRGAFRQAIQHSLASGTGYELEFRNVWTDGSIHWMAAKEKSFRKTIGPSVMIGVTLDITDRKRAEQDMRFLSTRAPHSPRSWIQQYVAKGRRACSTQLRRWCTVDMLDDNGNLRRLAVSHIDPGKVELAHEVYRRFPPEPSAPGGVWKILRTGKPKLISEINDELLNARFPQPELRQILRELGFKSYMGVPLRVRGRVLGVITFFAAEIRAAFTRLMILRRGGSRPSSSRRG